MYTHTNPDLRNPEELIEGGGRPGFNPGRDAERRARRPHLELGRASADEAQVGAVQGGDLEYVSSYPAVSEYKNCRRRKP